MRRLLLFVVSLVACSQVRAQWAAVLSGSSGAVETPIVADTLVDMAGGNTGDLLTAAILATGTHGTYSPPWVLDPDPTVGFTVGDSALAMQRPFSIGGTTYSTSQKSFVLDSAQKLVFVTQPFPGTATLVNYCGLLNLNTPSSGATSGARDILRVNGTTGTATLKLYTGGSGYRMQMENNPGVVLSGTLDQVPYTTVWVSGQVNLSTGLNKATLYDITTHASLGQITVTTSSIGTFTKVDFGNAGSGQGTGNLAFQNFAVDYSAHTTYPILYSTLGNLPADPLTPVAFTKGETGSGTTGIATGTVATNDMMVCFVIGYGGAVANHGVTSDIGGTWLPMGSGVEISAAHVTAWYLRSNAAGAISVTGAAGAGAAAVVVIVHKVTGLTGVFTGTEVTTDSVAGASTNPVAPAKTNGTPTSVYFGVTASPASGNPLVIYPGGANSTGPWRLADATNSQELNGNTYVGCQVVYQIVKTSASRACGFSTGNYFNQVAMEVVVH